MDNSIKKITAKELLDSWINLGLVPQSEYTHLGNTIISQQQEKTLPLYLRMLISIGALISSLSFISFLYISKIVYLPSEKLLCGIILIGLALILRILSKEASTTIKHSIFIQTSFCSMIVGKIVFIIGFATAIGVPITQLESKPWEVTLGLLLITAITYNIYPLFIDRFLSTLSLFLLIYISISGEFYFETYKKTALHLFYFIQIIIAATLLLNKRIKSAYIPLAYAIVCSLCITTILLEPTAKVLNWNNYNTIFINAILTFSLIALIYWAAKDAQKLKSQPIIFASLSALLLGIISADGLIFSLCLMILGYGKQDRPLLLIGAVFIPIFIFFYYYNLDIKLITKSVILIGSGLILLVARGYLNIKKLDREA